MADEICNVHGPYEPVDGKCPFCHADRAPEVPRTVVAQPDSSLLGLLVQIRGMRRGDVHKITGEDLLIGRDEAVANLALDDEQVSGLHAQVTRRGRQFYVEDLGSSNGTYLNDQRLTETHALREDDCLRIGGQSFVLKTVLL